MKLIVLHGHTMNAAVMRAHLGDLVDVLERELDIVFAEAPHTCTEAAVDSLYAIWKAPRLAPPHRTWWVSTEDGREYRGWEETHERIRDAVAGEEVAFLGFSQGAILSTAIAALGERGEMPRVRFAILVAGRAPRSDLLQPFLTSPLRTPSLHIWRTADTMAMQMSEELTARFDPATREVVVWGGDHRVPTRGEGAEAIVRLVRKHVQAARN
jgi:hypothetical protein